MASQSCKRSFYPHQRKAWRYVLPQDHPALYMEMRLGKTLVTVRRCLLYKPRDPTLGLRVLVAAPGSALGAWEKECREEGVYWQWLTGCKKERRQRLDDMFDEQTPKLPAPVFGLLNKEGWLALPEVADQEWDAVVADESAFLKNPRAKVTKYFLRNFRSVPHRWALTGTPNPEGEEDYFCQLAWLWGGALGCRSFWQFRARFMQPHARGWGWVMKPGAADVVRREVGRRCLVMRRRDVGMERKKVFERRELELPQEVRKAYAKAEADFILEWDGKEAKRTIWTTAAWQWLRQLASGFIEGRLVWPGKVQEVCELVMGELSRDKVVVWACYNAEVEALEQNLCAAGCKARKVWGADPLEVRERKRRAFMTGACRVLVLQQAIAQTGVDLSAADTAIYFSTPCGQMARVQTEDRILSLQKTGPLLYLDLMTKGTVDVDVLAMLASKTKLTDRSLSTALAVAIRERIAWTAS